MEKANDLQALLRQNAQANAYFSSLPPHIQEMVLDRAQAVQTEDTLHRYAENLMEGDK